MRKYILASGSPRRIAIMADHGLNPIIMPASIEENLPLNSGMAETVNFLALKKSKHVEAEYFSLSSAQNSLGAQDASPSLSPDQSVSCPLDSAPIIIAADTIVYFEGEIMGKPKDKADGFRMLSALRGNVHFVATGVALVEAGKQNSRVFCEITKVYFRDYSDEELLAYLDTDEAYDKAGGYAIQGAFKKYIDHIEGDYDNVVGFPWNRIEAELARL